MKRKIFLFTAVITLLVSCNSTKSSSNTSTLKKESISKYKIVTIDGIENVTKNPTLNLDLVKNTVSGKTPCNQYGGNIIIEANTIKFDRIRATQMYCVDFAKIESVFTKSLALITKYRIKDNQILLYDKADNLLLVGELEK